MAYGEGGAICSTETAKALEQENLPRELQYALDKYFSGHNVKGPAALEHALQEYFEHIRKTPIILPPIKSPPSFWDWLPWK